MSKINDDGPAFPVQLEANRDGYAITGGMTLRDYFAAKAMQSHITALSAATLPDWNAEIARLSYLVADAMLKAREEGGAA